MKNSLALLATSFAYRTLFKIRYADPESAGFEAKDTAAL